MSVTGGSKSPTPRRLPRTAPPTGRGNALPAFRAGTGGKPAEATSARGEAASRMAVRRGAGVKVNSSLSPMFCTGVLLRP